MKFKSLLRRVMFEGVSQVNNELWRAYYTCNGRPVICGVDPTRCYGYLREQLTSFHRRRDVKRGGKYHIILNNIDKIDHIYNNFNDELQRLKDDIYNIKRLNNYRHIHDEIRIRTSCFIELDANFVFETKEESEKVLDFCKIVSRLWFKKPIQIDKFLIHKIFK